MTAPNMITTSFPSSDSLISIDVFIVAPSDNMMFIVADLVQQLSLPQIVPLVANSTDHHMDPS